VYNQDSIAYATEKWEKWQLLAREEKKRTDKIWHDQTGMTGHSVKAQNGMIMMAFSEMNISHWYQWCELIKRTLDSSGRSAWFGLIWHLSLISPALAWRPDQFEELIREHSDEQAWSRVSPEMAWNRVISPDQLIWIFLTPDRGSVRKTHGWLSHPFRYGIVSMDFVTVSWHLLFVLMHSNTI